MEQFDIPENPYLLLTPGPLSTSQNVRKALFQDWCTWDSDYNNIVQVIRKKLVSLATTGPGYTSVLMQGSGTFSMEATIGSVIPPKGVLLVLSNGAYGRRMATIARKLRIAHHILESEETEAIDVSEVAKQLLLFPEITHIAMVHCETTTGILNDIEPICDLVKSKGKVMILDAMSSFGGIPLDVDELGIDYLISSANKCIQGVPGFGFIIAKTNHLKSSKGFARSHSLDLYDQWETMEQSNGKWRFTSPTHTVRAFQQALAELDEEGGINKRHKRYKKNQKLLRKGMEALGFECLLPKKLHSPFITSFLCPKAEGFSFEVFYQILKSKGFVIYPGKVSDADTFRIGNIGEVYKDDIIRLLEAINQSIFWEKDVDKVSSI